MAWNSRSKFYFQVGSGSVVLLASCLGLYYVLTSVFGFTTRGSIVLLLPVILLVAPVVVWIYRDDYSASHSEADGNHNQCRRESALTKTIVLRTVIALLLAGVSSALAAGYVARGENGLGLAMSVMALVCYVVALPAYRRLMTWCLRLFRL